MRQNRGDPVAVANVPISTPAVGICMATPERESIWLPARKKYGMLSLAVTCTAFGTSVGAVTGVKVRAVGSQIPVWTTRSPELQSDRKSTRLNSSHANISYAVFCL